MYSRKARFPVKNIEIFCFDAVVYAADKMFIQFCCLLRADVSPPKKAAVLKAECYERVSILILGDSN
jgi:hypothetical protein